MEEWRYIKNTNNKYLISNLGNVKSICYRNSKKEKILNCYGHNYKMVKLTINNIRKDYYVHRLVAETFLENPNNYKCVNHINGNKKDNRVDNLEWCTYKHNTIESFRLGLSNNKTGKGNGKSIPVAQYTKNNKFVKLWDSMNLAEKDLGIRHISDCIKNKRKTAGGFIWKLVEEHKRKEVRKYE